MPIYEYCCNKCQKDFELLIRNNSQDQLCPSCGTKDVEKKFSVFGFQSKGRGMVTSSGSSCGGCSSHNCGGCKH
jgi:putative FmdB family regulatory protein